MITPTNSDAPALLVEVTRLCEELRAERAALHDTLNNAIALCEKLRAERDDMTAGLVEAGEEVLILRAERDKLRDAIEEALTWRGTDTTHAKLRAALERPAP